ncbi:methyltransferase [Mycoplasmopsis californica HAZ160_1]|uniref:Methyltransferase n=2 Tax=Mycoplasmopsis californica TaxID=2113 RepID=A0A059XQI8_9BACT|nr:tRNA1(Val) (adenine(37)-N6)-methyltransferase [Mycoplasmopsis californica]AIA29265.1 methyltransferase [Mycoplasmopsis californica]BAP01273.1 methyltransferase [Mycoplasmopsis californica HAZ160_1]BBG41147.1 methyltransferase [Mycoplasmopsis californica]BBG41740.1 methyltransferase [Mycoplasmopsis californica]BBG42334.1 methyltransferase [Mycoplasmopsis californica]
MEKRKLVKNSLGFDSNLYIYQDKDMFNYSVDTILLGNFVFLNNRILRMLEIGTNNGALSIFISERNPKLKIDAIEIQSKAVELAEKNVKMNNKKEQINVIHADFNEFYQEQTKLNANKYQSIVVNPPFYPPENMKLSAKTSEEMMIATHEIKINLEQIIQGSAKIIEQKGYLTMVIPVERMVDCFQYMREYKFEPKRIQFIIPRVDDKPKLVLIESRYQAGWGVHFLPNLYLHDPDNKIDHEYLPQIKELYKPKKVKEL